VSISQIRFSESMDFKGLCADLESKGSLNNGDDTVDTQIYLYFSQKFKQCSQATAFDNIITFHYHSHDVLWQCLRFFIAKGTVPEKLSKSANLFLHYIFLIGFQKEGFASVQSNDLCDTVAGFMQHQYQEQWEKFEKMTLIDAFSEFYQFVSDKQKIPIPEFKLAKSPCQRSIVLIKLLLYLIPVFMVCATYNNYFMAVTGLCFVMRLALLYKVNNEIINQEYVDKENTEAFSDTIHSRLITNMRNPKKKSNNEINNQEYVDEGNTEAFSDTNHSGLMTNMREHRNGSLLVVPSVKNTLS